SCCEVIQNCRALARGAAEVDAGILAPRGSLLGGSLSAIYIGPRGKVGPGNRIAHRSSELDHTVASYCELCSMAAIRNGSRCQMLGRRSRAGDRTEIMR